MMKFFFAAVLMLSQISMAKAENLLIVGEDEIRQAIEQEFVEQGQNQNVDLELFGGQTVFHIQNAQKAKILVSGLTLDELQNKFSCNAEIFADGKSFAKTDISGRFYLLSEIWVPARNIQKGELIKPEMLRQIQVRVNRIKPSFVTDKDKLVGLEAKKLLKEGKIVSDRDVGKQMLIKKGDTVTVVYKTDKMQITAKVEALNDGGEGDKIELLNPKSKKTLFGEVLDKDTVSAEVQ